MSILFIFWERRAIRIICCSSVRLHGNVHSRHLQTHNGLSGQLFLSVDCEMPDLKLLRPLVLFCNVTGLFPFHMEIDPLTKSFSRLSLSFRKVHFWWFISVAIMQATLFSYAIYSLLAGFDQIEKIFQGPIMKIGLIVLAIALAVVIAAPRIFFFSYRRLQEACLLIKEVDDRLWLIDAVPCSTTRQMILFIMFTCTSVSEVSFYHLYNMAIRQLYKSTFFFHC